MTDNVIVVFSQMMEDCPGIWFMNIKDRVEDMAGTVQLLTAPKQGLAVDIRIPYLI